MIRDHVKKKDVKIELCPTQEMVADCMTKPLKLDLHVRTSDKMMGYTTQMTNDGVAPVKPKQGKVPPKVQLVQTYKNKAEALAAVAKLY